MAQVSTMASNLLIVLVLWGLVPLAALVGGLLIFFKGRAHVRKKYGRK